MKKSDSSEKYGVIRGQGHGPGAAGWRAEPQGILIGSSKIKKNTPSWNMLIKYKIIDMFYQYVDIINLSWTFVAQQV